MLTLQQIERFAADGFIVLEDLIAPDWLDKLKASASQIIADWQDEGRHIFTTDSQARSDDDFFLDSAEKVCCFFEEDAFDKQGQLVQDKALSINKIGHALHELNPVFAEFSHQVLFDELAKALGQQQPQIRQSMYIFKQPNIGGVVRWHQDATFFFTTPQSVLTYWFALEDATLQNGCLWVEPGGHLGPLREQFKRHGRATEVATLDTLPWPTDDSAVPLEVKAGTLVLFHGLLPHYSAPNRSSTSRQAFTLHVTDGATVYAKENWLQPNILPLRGFAG